MSRALAALRVEAARLVPVISASISEELGCRGSGGNAASNRRNTVVASAGSASTRLQSNKSALSLFPVVLHLLTSPHFRTAVVSAQLVSDLATWLTFTSGPAAGGTIGGGAGGSLATSSGSPGSALLADFKTTLMHVLEVRRHIVTMCAI